MRPSIILSMTFSGFPDSRAISRLDFPFARNNIGGKLFGRQRQGRRKGDVHRQLFAERRKLRRIAVGTQRHQHADRPSSGAAAL